VHLANKSNVSFLNTSLFSFLGEQLFTITSDAPGDFTISSCTFLLVFRLLDIAHKICVA
jgi:hypothetical protein